MLDCMLYFSRFRLTRFKVAQMAFKIFSRSLKMARFDKLVYILVYFDSNMFRLNRLQHSGHE